MRITFFILPKTRRKMAILTLVFLLLVAGVFLPQVLGWRQAVPSLLLSNYTVVIDPGHGGYDPGVRRNDIVEKVVVLNIALILRDYLHAAGARVVMTREADRDLLVLPTAGAKKRRDMENRLKIITDANPALLISVHANGSSDSLWRGAQVFFKAGCVKSEKLAGMIQQELRSILANTNRQPQFGEFFILNQVGMPAVLVETGFISNPQEARLLLESEYQNKVAWAISLAVINYFEQGVTLP